jgi:hypothetical protein
MFAGMLLRVGSLVLHSVMGGMSMFCLYYAGQISDFRLARNLLTNALLWGGLAVTVIYCQNKYRG